MSAQGYRQQPDEIGMARAERAIRVSGLIGLLALACAVPAGYFLLPLVFDFPDQLAERLAFAARANAVVLLCVLAAVGLVSSTRRVSPADIGGSAAGAPSDRIAIYVAFLQWACCSSWSGEYFSCADTLAAPSADRSAWC